MFHTSTPVSRGRAPPDPVSCELLRYISPQEEVSGRIRSTREDKNPSLVTATAAITSDPSRGRGGWFSPPGVSTCGAPEVCEGAPSFRLLHREGKKIIVITLHEYKHSIIIPCVCVCIRIIHHARHTQIGACGAGGVSGNRLVGWRAAMEERKKERSVICIYTT